MDEQCRNNHLKPEVLLSAMGERVVKSMPLLGIDWSVESENEGGGRGGKTEFTRRTALASFTLPHVFHHLLFHRFWCCTTFVMGELFPSEYRQRMGTISVSFSVLCTFVVVRTFPLMATTMGLASVYGIYAT
jgi:hypothetical protein